MKLWKKFAAVAEAAPDRVAVCSADERISYVRLREHAVALAERLAEGGVGRGVAVLTLLGNEPDVLVALLACDRIGAVFVPIDPSLTAAEVRRIVLSFGGQFHVVSSPNLIGRLAPVDASYHAVSGCEVVQARVPSSAEPIDELRDTAMIQFTSGSTGESKGIMVGDAAMYHRAKSVADALGLHAEDRTLCSVPLSHSHGVDCLALPSLLTGGRLYITSASNATPGAIWPMIERHRISFFSSVPGFYRLAARVPPAGGPDLSSLRLPFCGSAALSQQVAEDFLDKFGIAIRQGYGLAEIAVITVNLEAASTRKFDSIGVPIPGIRHRIGADGELIVASDSLAHGYFRQTDLWAETVIGGELHTGDLVSVDEAGFMYLVGRKSSIINIGGHKVYPPEVEQALVELPWVQEVAVVGSDDPATGQRVEAHVVVLTGGDRQPASRDDAAAAMQDHLRGKLSAFKLPKRYAFHDTLPKSPLGKIQRERLEAPSTEA